VSDEDMPEGMPEGMEMDVEGVDMPDMADGGCTIPAHMPPCSVTQMICS
jgi:hypothetical protein